MIHPQLVIAITEEKGRGVFTTGPIAADTVVEIAPVIVVTAKERPLLEKTILHDYIFSWGPSGTEAAVGLGYSSIYNHASPSNCEYVMHFENRTISVVTMRAIEAGEELTINYSTSWNEQQPVWFDAV